MCAYLPVYCGVHHVSILEWLCGVCTRYSYYVFVVFLRVSFRVLFDLSFLSPGFTEETLPTPRELLSHSSLDIQNSGGDEDTSDEREIHIIVRKPRPSSFVFLLSPFTSSAYLGRLK